MNETRVKLKSKTPVPTILFLLGSQGRPHAARQQVPWVGAHVPADVGGGGGGVAWKREERREGEERGEMSVKRSEGVHRTNREEMVIVSFTSAAFSCFSGLNTLLVVAVAEQAEG